MILLFLCVVPILLVFAMVRNHWVYSTRKRILWSDFELYKKLPDYNTMFLRFWIWNVDNFLQKKDNT